MSRSGSQPLTSQGMRRPASQGSLRPQGGLGLGSSGSTSGSLTGSLPRHTPMKAPNFGSRAGPRCSSAPSRGKRGEPSRPLPTQSPNSLVRTPALANWEAERRTWKKPATCSLWSSSQSTLSEHTGAVNSPSNLHWDPIHRHFTSQLLLPSPVPVLRRFGDAKLLRNTWFEATSLPDPFNPSHDLANAGGADPNGSAEAILERARAERPLQAVARIRACLRQQLSGIDPIVVLVLGGTSTAYENAYLESLGQHVCQQSLLSSCVFIFCSFGGPGTAQRKVAHSFELHGAQIRRLLPFVHGTSAGTTPTDLLAGFDMQGMAQVVPQLADAYILLERCSTGAPSRVVKAAKQRGAPLFLLEDPAEDDDLQDGFAPSVLADRLLTVVRSHEEASPAQQVFVVKGLKDAEFEGVYVKIGVEHGRNKYGHTLASDKICFYVDGFWYLKGGSIVHFCNGSPEASSALTPPTSDWSVVARAPSRPSSQGRLAGHHGALPGALSRTSSKSSAHTLLPAATLSSSSSPAANGGQQQQQPEKPEDEGPDVVVDESPARLPMRAYRRGSSFYLGTTTELSPTSTPKQPPISSASSTTSASSHGTGEVGPMRSQRTINTMMPQGNSTRELLAASVVPRRSFAAGPLLGQTSHARGRRSSTPNMTPWETVPSSLFATKGSRLATLIKCGAIGLVKSGYFTDCWLNNRPFGARQKIPSPQFWNPQEALKQWQQLGKCFLCVVSHPWLSRRHPDPHRFHLERLVKVLEEYRNLWGLSEVAVIMDYCSVWQSGGTERDLRTELQRLQAAAGLREITLSFAHQAVTTIRLLDVPSEDSRKYEDRGWTLLESIATDCKGGDWNSWSFENFVPEWTPSTDSHGWFAALSRPRRIIPMSLQSFQEELEARRAICESKKKDLFADPEDEQRAIDTYCDFLGQVCQKSSLAYPNTKLSDAELTSLAEVLVECTDLKSLDLSNNYIGEEGTTSLARIVPRLKKLTHLVLTGNPVCNEPSGQESLKVAWRVFMRNPHGLIF